MHPSEPLFTNEVPIMEEIVNFKGSYKDIAIMCAIRRPKLSALWLGAVISGLAPMSPSLRQEWYATSRSQRLRMDGLFTVINGLRPVFLDWLESRCLAPLFPPPVVDDDLHYESLQFAPWKPIGTTSV